MPVRNALAAAAMMWWSAPAPAENCAAALSGTGWQPPQAISRSATLNFDAFADRLSQQRVVVIGEAHDRYDHHLNQLELICRLYRQHGDLAIGLEMFQLPFQDALDDYIARRIDTHRLLARTEYYRRWQYDYRLYAPILAFARDNNIPLVALNATQEISSKVAREGISGLSDEERAQIPAELDRDVPDYRRRLRAVFDQHPEIRRMSFDHFVEAQLVWDETMSDRAARYLKAHPGRPLVVIAGNGHVARSGIPARFERRSGVHPAVVRQGDPEDDAPEHADHLLASPTIELPPTGRLGVMLDARDNRIVVSGFSDDSAAKAAGILENDQIVRLNDALIEDFADLKLRLMDKRPGDEVSVTVERAGAGGTKQYPAFRLTLR